jgi:hypothetical protein
MTALSDFSSEIYECDLDCLLNLSMYILLLEESTFYYSLDRCIIFPKSVCKWSDTTELLSESAYHEVQETGFKN